jgi:hypothetical protein
MPYRARGVKFTSDKGQGFSHDRDIHDLRTHRVCVHVAVDVPGIPHVDELAWWVLPAVRLIPADATVPDLPRLTGLRAAHLADTTQASPITLARMEEQDTMKKPIPDGKYTAVDEQRNEPRIVTVRKGKIDNAQRPDGSYYTPRGIHAYQLERDIRKDMDHLL